MISWNKDIESVIAISNRVIETRNIPRLRYELMCGVSIDLVAYRSYSQLENFTDFGKLLLF